MIQLFIDSYLLYSGAL